MKRDILRLVLVSLIGVAVICSGIGCGLKGYTNGWPYPEEYQTVYVEMFDSAGFRRGYEFILTDALAKQVEARTPYKIVSSADRADTVLSGVVTVGSAILATDRFTGTPLETEALIEVQFTWKDLKTGQIIRADHVAAEESFSTKLGQQYEYAARSALNKAAQKIVDHMEIPW